MIIPLHFGVKGMSGHPLAGGKLMRFIYIDEAGTSAKEPVLVVAGIIVHADQQWKILEERLHKMVPSAIPPDQRNGFRFHATELFSGGKVFDRSRWPKEARWALLEELVSIPAEFSLPIVIGFARKQSGGSTKGELGLSHVIAFSDCIDRAERFMRDFTDNEVAIITAEDNTEMRRALKAAVDAKKGAGWPPVLEHVPLTHIVDTVHFAQKHEASLLQIADACAFVVKRHLVQAPHNERFLQALCGGRVMPAYLGTMLNDQIGGLCLLPVPISHPAHQPHTRG